MKRLWSHPLVVVLSNLLLLMGLYTLCRVAYYGFNISMYPDITGRHLLEMLLGGMRFDLTAILYLSSVYILLSLLPLPGRASNQYQKATKLLFLIPNLLGIFANVVDMVYTPFAHRRITLSFFLEFENENNFLPIVLQATYQYWYVTLTLIGLIVLCVVLYRPIKDSAIYGSKRVYYIRESVLLVVSIVLSIIGIRGGVGSWVRPITLSNALLYTHHPDETNIVLNTPFCILRSSPHKKYHAPSYFPPEELPGIMNPVHAATGGVNKDEKLNVVVLILESFSKEYIGFYHTDIAPSYESYTPFLDSLLPHCITYEHSFAAGRKSIDAMPSVLSSIPMLVYSYFITPYSTNAVMSLASCLKEMGYSSAFFHGAPNGSMGFQAFAHLAGFDAYYGMDDYDGPDAFDGTWAIWDEEFLQYYARTMNTMQEPFMTTVFTASSHHPFKVPERYKSTFPKGKLPIHHCIGYSDYALREFFDSIKTAPWYDHTLFVITADHTNKLQYASSNTGVGYFEIPIAFYCPAWGEGRLVTEGTVSQTDIMPSVLKAVGYDQPFIAFGEDILFDAKSHPYAICYDEPEYQILSDSLILLFDGNTLTDVYAYKEDPLLEHNLMPEAGKNAQVQAMLQYLKGYIQQYMERMIDNRLTYGSQSR